MNKSQIFSKAHAIAKTIAGEAGHYVIAFGIALKEVYNSLKKDTATKLLELGMTVWGESFGKDRIYINIENMLAVFGLEITRYKTGNISYAELHGEKISNSKAYKLLSGKIYYCLKAKKFFGTNLEAII